MTILKSPRNNYVSLVCENIVKQDSTHHNVFGVVTKPMVRASDGIRFSKEAIQRAAHNFLAKYRTIGYRHQQEADAYPIESYITMQDMGDPQGEGYIPVGSWIIGVHVNSQEIWQEIEEGKIKGFSLGGMILGIERDGNPGEEGDQDEEDSQDEEGDVEHIE